jgi:hypothetical protein
LDGTNIGQATYLHNNVLPGRMMSQIRPQCVAARRGRFFRSTTKLAG